MIQRRFKSAPLVMAMIFIAFHVVPAQHKKQPFLDTVSTGSDSDLVSDQHAIFPNDSRLPSLTRSLSLPVLTVSKSDVRLLRPSHKKPAVGSDARLAQLVEANIIAVHAFQVLLAKQSGKGEACFSANGLSENELKALSEHQAQLLKSDIKQVRLWVQGRQSTFNAAKDLESIFVSTLKIPDNAPVNVFTNYLRQNTKASDVKVRAIASLYQTVLEVERDGDRLQEEFAFYIGLGLPVYVGQLNLPGTDADLLTAGRKLEGLSCEAPVGTSAAEWQIAGRKIWNWGEKNLHIRDERVVAAELLKEPEV